MTDLSTPIPKKVKQGEFLEHGLRLETTLQEAFEITWGDIVFLFLGKVEETHKAVQPEKPGINVIRTSAALAAGPIGTAAYDLVAGKKKKEPQASHGNSYLLLDLYATDRREPFRFDSTGTNYRTFLGEEAGYAGETNLLTFIRKLATKIQLDSTLLHLLEKGKSAIPPFPSRDAFAWASFKTRGSAD